MALYYRIGETMIEVGDLVKFKRQELVIQRDRGVWLVVDVRTDKDFGELATLKKGNDHQSHVPPRELNKISSSR